MVPSVAAAIRLNVIGPAAGPPNVTERLQITGAAEHVHPEPLALTIPDRALVLSATVIVPALTFEGSTTIAV